MVEDLLQEQKRAVRDLMSNNRHLVEALRDALLERHELIGAQITDVLSAAAAAHGDLGRPGVAWSTPTRWSTSTEVADGATSGRHGHRPHRARAAA